MLDDWRTAPVDSRTRAALGLIEKLTLQPEEVGADDIRPLLDAGLDPNAIEDAIQACVLFNVYDRLADSLEFEIPDSSGFAISARMMLKRGYRF